MDNNGMAKKLKSSGEKFIRALGPSEVFTDASTVHRNLVTAIGVQLRIKKDFDYDSVFEALSRLQKEHIQLGVTIKRKEIDDKGENIKSEFWQIESPNVALQWIFTKNQNEVEKILEESIQVTFEEGSLLWRAIWLTSAWNNTGVSSGERIDNFVFVYHPAIGDIKGGLLLVNDWLKHFSDVLYGKSPKLKPAEMQPPSFELFSKELKEKAEKVKNEYDTGSSIYIEKNPIPAVSDYTTRQERGHFRGMEASLGQKVIVAVQEKNISFKAFFTAVGISAMHKILGFENGENVKFRATFEVNLRKFCEKESNQIHGCVCDYTEVQFESGGVTNKEEFWALASKCDGILKPKLKDAKLIKFSTTMMGNPYQWFSNGCTREVRNDFVVCIQEMDEFLNAPEIGFEIQDAKIHSAAYCMGTPFEHLVTVFKGRLSHTLLFSCPYVNRGQGKEYAQKSLEFMQMAV